LQKEGLPFADVLPEERIEDAFAEEEADFARGEDDVYTPATTLWAFLSQVLFKNEQRSCLAAVSRVLVLLAALGREPCAKNSGGYFTIALVLLGRRDFVTRLHHGDADDRRVAGDLGLRWRRTVDAALARNQGDPKGRLYATDSRQIVWEPPQDRCVPATRRPRSSPARWAV
jgi:hypothetical protein